MPVCMGSVFQWGSGRQDINTNSYVHTLPRNAQLLRAHRVSVRALWCVVGDTEGNRAGNRKTLSGGWTATVRHS